MPLVLPTLTRSSWRLASSIRRNRRHSNLSSRRQRQPEPSPWRYDPRLIQLTGYACYETFGWTPADVAALDEDEAWRISIVLSEVAKYIHKQQQQAERDSHNEATQAARSMWSWMTTTLGILTWWRFAKKSERAYALVEVREEIPMKDPVTGDELKPLEYFARQVQVVVRTPWFLLLFNLTTIAIFLGRGDVWNYFASWLAIIIEWLVGTYMFGQTGRDAIIIRTIKKELTEKVERMEAEHSKKLLSN